MSALDVEKKTAFVLFANHQLVFTGLGALYWPKHQLIVIADLHLEKGSYYAQKGNPLPLYDTLDTLTRLQRIVDLFKPKKILSLGDNIHDKNAFMRMHRETKQLLKQIAERVDDWIWLVGNHDHNVTPEFLQFRFYTHWEMDNITFSHDFLENIPHQIVGHYHPKVKVKKICGKCFLYNDNKIIMPSFGSYTGGMDINSTEFKRVTQNELFQAYLLNKEKIWYVQ